MRTSSRSRRRVLIDTAAFYAFADEGDRHHQESVAIFTTLMENEDRLFTTSFILAETHALLLNRLNRRASVQFLRDTEAGTNITVIWIGSGDVKTAREIIYRYDDKQFSLTDATSFAVMERLRITHALTLDRHFAQYGFPMAVLTDGK